MRDLRRSQFDIFLTILTTLFVVVFDRVTKSFFSDLLSLNESSTIIPNVLDMTLVHNTGIAFGLFKDQGMVFIIIPVIAIFLLIFNVYFYRQNGEVLDRTYIIAFSLILGGAIGNLYDRIVFGHVIDFINFHVWPVFNVADSAITVGAVLIAFKCIQQSAK